MKYDLVGPPDTASNLRPIKFKIPENETELQKRLRNLREETQEFNQKFWSQHNSEFVEGRDAHIQKVLKEKYQNEVNKSTISAEEMSVYYKKFLDSKWRSHIDYNLEWQKRNFTILFLGKFWILNCETKLYSGGGKRPYDYETSLMVNEGLRACISHSQG